MLVGIYAIVTSTQHGWGSAHTLGLGAVALALLAAFFVLESRLANPIMPLGILRLRSLMGSSVVRAAARHRDVLDVLLRGRCSSSGSCTSGR